MNKSARLWEQTPVYQRKIFSIKELTTVLKDLLEANFPLVWVEGEVANLRLPRSGHIYFTLRDEEASLRAVLFRTQRSFVPFSLEEGLHVVCLGRLSVYAPRGEYQLIVQLVEPRGLGALQLALEQLKRKLQAEGLFASERKRPLPLVPAKVGVVTSLSGAALRDFLKVALLRWPKAHIQICPVRVQGEKAAQEIVQALRLLGEDPSIEVIVVTRGGGSLEDLWAFNEEVVARAVYASPVPVVSAVGHEIDYTICDLVADVRVPTPTAAAQIVFPSEEELKGLLTAFEKRLQQALARVVETNLHKLKALSARLRDPRRNLKDFRQQLTVWQGRLDRACNNLMRRKTDQFHQLLRQLEAVSPLAVLSRGYSVIRRLPEGDIIREAQRLKKGDKVEIIFHKGLARATIDEVGGEDS